MTMLKICCSARFVLLISMLLAASQAQAAESLFTTLTNGEIVQLGTNTELVIEASGTGVHSQLDWVIPLTEDSLGMTFIGSRQTLGNATFFNFNKALTNGLGDSGLGVGLISSGGAGSTYGKPDMFQDFTPVPPDRHIIDSNFTPLNGLDMAGFHLTKMKVEITELTFTASTVDSTFVLRIYGDEGQVPEPSTAALFVFALCLLICHHTPHWRR